MRQMDVVGVRVEMPSNQPIVLLREVEGAFAAQRGLRTTAAAWAAAILCDLGLTPDQVEAVSNAWVSVCIYGQAAFSRERGLAPVPPAPMIGKLPVAASSSTSSAST